jgi:hypothetical protein
LVPVEQTNTEIDAGALAAAHRQLLSDGDIQFTLPAMVPPQPPGWLKWLLQALKPLLEYLAKGGPVVKILFWGAVAILVALLLRALWIWLAPLVRRWLGRSPDDTAERWQPDAAPARALLAEADALAAGGAYAEAAHLLLLRSVEQLDARFPGRLRPSLTSRDIARAPMLPPAMASAFAQIAAVVETGLFGQRPVSAEAWQHCRRAYETAAFGTSA